MAKKERTRGRESRVGERDRGRDERKQKKQLEQKNVHVARASVDRTFDDVTYMRSWTLAAFVLKGF